MKRFTFLLTMLLIVGFSWLGNAQFTEDFEGTFLPAGWVKELPDTSNDITQSSSQNHTAGGANSARFSSYNSSGDYNQYLFTAAINVGAGTNDQISFWHRKHNSSSELLEWGISTSGQSSTDVASWTAVTLSDSEWTKETIDLSAFDGQTIYFAWHYYGDFLYYVYLDDVVNDAIPTCVEPTDLNATNITTVSADLNWTAASGAVDYNWEVQPQGTAQGTAGAVASGTGVAGTTVNTGDVLTEKTYYDFYIQTNCDGDGTSSWAGPVTFYTWYCESIPSSNDGNGISNVQLATTDYTNGDVTYHDFTGDTVVDFQQSAPANIQITFETGYTYDTNIWIDLNDNLEFEASEQVFDGESTSDNPTTLDAGFTVDAAAPLGSHIMRIGTADTGQSTPNPCYNGSFGVTLDFKVNITPPPSCVVPSDLIVTGKVADEADLAWIDNNASDPDNGWEYEIVDVTAGGAVTGSGTVTTTNPIHVTGLTVDNEYKFLVRALCDDTTSSDWSAEYAWTQTEVPGCASNPNPVDGADDVPQGNVTFTWDAPTTGGTATSYDLYAGSTAALEYGLINNYTTPSADLHINGFNTTLYWQIIPKNAGGEADSGCPIWSFTTSGPHTDDCAGYSSDPDPDLDIPDNDDTGVSDTINVTGTGPDVLDDLDVIIYADHTYLGDLEVTLTSPTGTSVVLFDNHCGTNETMDIIFDDEGAALVCGTPTSGTYAPTNPLSAFNGETFDGDWVLTFVDSADGDTGTLNKWCLVPTLVSCPTPMTLTASNETSTGADLAWTEVGSATVWDVEIGVQGFAPTGTPTNDNVANPYTWTAGSETTTYDYYVRADCAGDDSDVSTWAGPFSFTTLANCVEPSDLNATNITTDSADLSWTENNDPAGDTWNIEWGESGFTQGNGTMITGTNTNPFNLTGLSSKSTYDFYVQTDCGGGSTSPWAGPYTFTTPGTCGTYSISLEDTYGDGWNGGEVDVYVNGVLEIADFTLDDGSGPVSVDLPVDIDDIISIDYTAGSYSTENVYYIYDDGGVAVVTEGDGGVAPEDTGDYTIPTGYITCDSCPDPSDLVVSNETSSGADIAWTVNGTETTWDLYIVTSGSAAPDASTTPTVDDTSDNPYTWTDGSAETDYDVYVRSSCDTDDWVGAVTFTTLAFCVAPDGTATNNITTNSADLSWTDNAGEVSDEFEIVYGVPGFDPDTEGTTISDVSNPYTLTGLSASTDYEWYVRSNCVDEETHEIGDSDWSSVNAFTTFSDEALDWNNLQWPSVIEMTNGSTIADNDIDGNGNLDDPLDVYAQAYEPGVTNDGDDPADAGDGIQAWIGYGPTGSTPDDSWTWIVATYNTDSGNNDEYTINFGGSNTPPIGTWDYASRFKLGSGVYTYGGTDGIWDHDSGTITVNPIDGDSCTTAIALTLGHVFDNNDIVGSNVGATASGDAADPTCSNFGSGEDVWYTVVVPDSGDITIETNSNPGSSMTDTAMSVYEGSCGALTQVECDDDGGDGYFSLIDLTGRTPGETLYIRVFEYGNNLFDTFLISAYSQCHDVTTTWDGTAWSNGTPTTDTPAVIDGDYIGEPEFTACTVTITANGTLYVSAGETYTAVNDFVNDGEIYVENTGSFVQMSGEATVSGAGTFTVEQITTDYAEYDYTYFSSPSSTATVSAFTDAGSSASYIWELNTAAYNDADGDTYDDDGQGSEWTQKTGNLEPGIGYAVLGAGADLPFDSDDIDAGQNFNDTVEFDGAFNTGDVTVTLVADADDTDGFNNQNLIGNPYPSAIDIDIFYDVNSAVVSPTFYYWTHNTQLELVAGVGYVFTNDDYAVWTVGTGGAASGGTLGASQFVASCQGFLANADNPGDVIFTNAMRVVGNNNHFMSPTTGDDDKLWINMRGNGDFRQILVGFFDDATDNYEAYFDGPRMSNGSNTDFYTVIDGDDTHFAIQGLNTFNDTKTVPLGLEIVEAGDYTFEIDNSEGVFASGQVVYIYDNYTGTYHNLSEGSFTFTTAVGEAINDRFELRFTDVLASDVSELDKVVVYPNPSADIFNISWRGNTTASLQVYDLSGKVIIEQNNFNSANRTYQIDMSAFDAGVYFVRLSVNDRQIVKKLVLK